MSLNTIEASGSFSSHQKNEDQEDTSDILAECAGGCGKKILFFGLPVVDDWGDGIDGVLCIECRTASLSHGFDDDE